MAIYIPSAKAFGKNISLSKEQQLALQTEEFMKRRYEFRHNTQIGEVEYRERLSFRFRFNPLDKRALNSIALDAQMEGIRCGIGILVVIFTQPRPCIQPVGRFPLPASRMGW